MGFRALHVLLWFTTAFVLTTQVLLEVHVSPMVRAECGQQVTLHCNISSARGGLSIHRMEWFQKHKPLCHLDRDGNITEQHNHTTSGFHCEREQGLLSLVFQEVQPLETSESGNPVQYICKVRSNKGLVVKYTTVELEECGGSVHPKMTTERSTCTFTRVHPDGEVHWFHGSTRLEADSLKINTTKRVDKGGWLIVTSSLEKKIDDMEPYNCSLWNPTSSRYISSSLLQIPHRLIGPSSGAEAPRPLWTFWCFQFLAVLLMK